MLPRLATVRTSARKVTALPGLAEIFTNAVRGECPQNSSATAGTRCSGVIPVSLGASRHRSLFPAQLGARPGARN